MNLKDIIDAGIGVLLLMALVGGYRRYWVYWWVFQQKVDEAEFWKKMALISTGLAKQATRPPRSRRKDDA